jgi:hypothetical protein
MAWQIDYYDEDVQESIARWPVGIRAYYARIVERIMTFGPNMAHIKRE